jgi:hypothetical protein
MRVPWKAGPCAKLAGLGVVRAAKFVVREDIRAGRLVAKSAAARDRLTWCSA